VYSSLLRPETYDTDVSANSIIHLRTRVLMSLTAKIISAGLLTISAVYHERHAENDFVLTNTPENLQFAKELPANTSHPKE